MGLWGENKEITDLFRKRLSANPGGITSLIDDIRMDKRKLFLGGRSFKRLEIPPEIPLRMKQWYSMRDFYVGKDSPDYGMAFTENLAKEVKKDFKALAPLYRLFRGYADEIMNTDRKEE